MKKTKQRNIILEIINNSYDHLDAYGVYDEARKVLPNISLGTVYRNLKLLAQENIIKTIKVGGIVHYDKSSSRVHFICSKCQRIIDAHKIDVKNITNFDGNIVTDYKIVLMGVCKKCQKEENNGIKRK